MKNIPKNVEQARQDFAKTFSDGNGYRLFCASKRKDSVLMWSHYAKDHQGVVIEFDTGQRPFSIAPSDHILEVCYSNKKAVFNYTPKVERFRKALLAVAKTKSTDWKYEDEVRFVIPVAVCVENQFLRFVPQAIRSLIFGCRCSDKNYSEIMQELSRPHFSHVGISKTKLSSKEFLLEFEEVKSPS